MTSRLSLETKTLRQRPIRCIMFVNYLIRNVELESVNTKLKYLTGLKVIVVVFIAVVQLYLIKNYFKS